MKKLSLLFVFILCCIYLSAQVPYEETLTLDNYLNNAHNNSGTRSAEINPDEYIIYQRSVGMTNLPNFNLNRIDTASNSYFQQALTEIYQSSKEQIFTDYMGLRAKIGADEELLNTVNIGILNTKYSVLNYDESNPNNPNNAFSLVGHELRLIDGKKPYTTHYATVVSPLKDEVQGNSIRFKFRSDLIYSNGKPIQTLTADLGDGITRSIIKNGNLSINEATVHFSQTQRTVQTYHIAFTDGAILTTRSILFVYIPESTPRSGHTNTTDVRDFVSDYSFKGYDESTDLYGRLDYRVFHANSDKKLRKPLLIIDGFDPGDTRKIEQKDYKDPNDTSNNPPSIYDLMKYIDSQKKERYLVEDLNTKGYDVVIVNFPSDRIRKIWMPDFWFLPLRFRFVDGGADYIERNALTVATLIKKLNQEIKDNGSNEKLVVVGPSMGGQITRYALAWMEKNNIDHNTRLWVSFDSPHLGANIPIGMQSALYLMKEAGVPAGADKYNFMLKSPAAQQMLINQHHEHGSYS
ncbi:MAG: hypothetical protein Q4G63_13005 [Bacteroidia bacterium]|nr:hypothetical protein [Bacteroidia bacterium]